MQSTRRHRRRLALNIYDKKKKKRLSLDRGITSDVRFTCLLGWSGFCLNKNVQGAVHKLRHTR